MTDPSNSLGFYPDGQPLPPLTVSTEERLLAPIWHTVFIVLVLLANSFFSAVASSRLMAHRIDPVTEKGRMVQYAFTIALEFFLLFLVWIGLRLHRTKIRDLIGGRWSKPEDFLLDAAIAFGAFVVIYAVVIGLSVALGMNKPAQMEETKKLGGMLAPHTWGGLLLFILLSAVAGFVEEIIFRGYLQRQIGKLSRNLYVGLVVSAVIFGAGHGYEGPRRMLVIFVLGLIFGFVALLRKSLRPGMFAHWAFDASQGVVLFIATRTGMLS